MYKAMIVDDEDIIVAGLSKMLPWKEYNCEVIDTAYNGKDALKKIRREVPDILFTDIRMPEMDGLELIAALRSEFPLMQITILSGYSDFTYAQQAVNLGVSNYLLKPSKMEELKGALKKMVDDLNELNNHSESSTESAQKEKAQNQEELTAGNFIIQNTIKYMEENYSRKLSLPDVAEHVYVSQWHLSKLISKNTNQSFSELLNGIRIREAKKLLANPSLKIWEISEKVGFSDVTHFSRIFKKMENMSANEYRNTALNVNISQKDY